MQAYALFLIVHHLYIFQAFANYEPNLARQMVDADAIEADYKQE